MNFGHLYSEGERPGIPIRLTVGLHCLKHTYGWINSILLGGYL